MTPGPFSPSLFYRRLSLDLPEDGPTTFQTVLCKVLASVASIHPHHTIPILLALENGAQHHASKGDEPPTKRRKSGSGKSSDASAAAAGAGASENETRKASAARQLVDRVAACSPALAKLVSQSRRVFAAYIELAELDLGMHPRRANTSIDAFKGKYTLARLAAQDMDSVAVVTRVPEVRADGAYSDAEVVFIESFSDNFTLVGGINAPRRIRCLGSDGHAYKQLVKGNDDSRQDAVMQQVFGHVNEWLRSDAEGRKRCLQMGTYHVVPLSQRAGVLEWCENTLPLNRWLLMGSDSAHARYSPRGSWQHDVCRAKMKDAAETKHLPAHMTRPELLLRTYRKVCRHFPPVMRRFFFEQYHEPSEWFKRRLGFTHSAAVCSMVGYVLGLGDRHPNNILLHSETAELIHIDLGVAFEQGKLLPTPERVPFRLTRDLVDGMGAAGVEGPFRRTCEQTLRVLREGELSLLTILEVFLHDPLHSWRLSPEKAVQLQEIEEAFQPAVGAHHFLDSTVGSMATHTGALLAPLAAGGAAGAPTATGGGARLLRDAGSAETRSAASVMSNEQGEARRVLASLRSKLQGYYEGTQLGIHGQVNSLIQVSLEGLVRRCWRRRREVHIARAAVSMATCGAGGAQVDGGSDLSRAFFFL